MTTATLRKRECLLLAVVLVGAYHAIPWWGFRFLPSRAIYDRLGEDGYATLYDAMSGVMPFLLCIGFPLRSGLTFGRWEGRSLKVIGICLLPIVLTAIVYPFTSRPFNGGRIGLWLVSPLAQDLLFAGYLYGLFDEAFPGHAHRKCRVNRTVLLTAMFFALWHVPNFLGMAPTYVAFQLFYTIVGGAWMLLARQLTGSIIPGVVTHMACNFVSWL
ncbi:MAG: CPBP family intramembrane metalloprotease [Planctomycetes bacterium]|nr:CPBP family intramembrane metalloprotease [Planctomycetota bacterium]